jgi:hypothetical protein
VPTIVPAKDIALMEFVFATLTLLAQIAPFVNALTPAPTLAAAPI